MGSDRRTPKQLRPVSSDGLVHFFAAALIAICTTEYKQWLAGLTSHLT